MDEAKRRIHARCPEWTDHNVSDPGVTLIELFAWMTDLLLYRLNRVPENQYIHFLNLLGLRLAPPAAARTDLTFWLSAPATAPVLVPRGLEVATARVGGEDAVIFSTDADLRIAVPGAPRLLVGRRDDAGPLTDHTADLNFRPFPIFGDPPAPGDALYLCFGENLSGNVLALYFECVEKAGVLINPKAPPLAWEAWTKKGWTPAEWQPPEGDDTSGTYGLNKSGREVVFMPRAMLERELGGQKGYWLRIRHAPGQPGRPAERPYAESPQITNLRVEAIGGVVSATHSMTIENETLGISDGTPGQRFKLEYAPVLPRRPDEVLEVLPPRSTTAGPDTGNGASHWVAWTEVRDFADSGPDDLHYTLDDVTGEIRFGPAVRARDGTERAYGAIPPSGALLRFRRYRSGGGAAGNVGKDTLTILRSAPAYIDRVTNRAPASGGRDAERLEEAMVRAPRLLRTRERAVTAEDFEELTLQHFREIARARCLQPKALGRDGAPPPGMVYLLLVPHLDEHTSVSATTLKLADELKERVLAFFDERRLLTCVVEVREPEYRVVTVEARLRPRPDADRGELGRLAAERLHRFINPLRGGPRGDGWPFGRDLYISEVYGALQGLPGVEYIEDVGVYLDDPGRGRSGPHQRVALPDNALIVSGAHQIVVV